MLRVLFSLARTSRSGVRALARRGGWFAVALALALGGAGCGNDMEPSATPTDTSPTPSSTVPIRLPQSGDHGSPADHLPESGTTSQVVYSTDRTWHSYVYWREGYRGDLVVEGPNQYKRTLACGSDTIEECAPRPITFGPNNAQLLFSGSVDVGPVHVPAMFLLDLASDKLTQLTNTDPLLASPDPVVRLQHFVPDAADSTDFLWVANTISYSVRGVHYTIDTATLTVSQE